MRKIFTILSFIVLLAVTACGGEEGFVIKCEIEGLDTRGLEMVYMTRGGVSRASFHPVDGKVELKGTSSQPTLVEVFALDGSRLWSCVASDGDRLKVKMKLGDPSSLKVTGQDASRDYAAFVAQHDSILAHGSDSEVNRLISEAVRSNPASMASTLLMVTQFRAAGHELLADSLLNEIAPEARPALLASAYASTVGEQVTTSARGDVKSFTLRTGLDSLGHDTIVRYVPSMQSYSLLMFSDAARPDSITARLRSLRRALSQRRLKIIEISVAPDSAMWHAYSKGDSINWYQAWAPGSTSGREIRRLAIPRTPFYIVADSSGAQLYRGTSAYEADRLIRSRMPQKAPADTIKATTDSITPETTR